MVTLGFSVILAKEWWSWFNVPLKGSDIVIDLLTSVLYTTIPVEKQTVEWQRAGNHRDLKDRNSC